MTPVDRAKLQRRIRLLQAKADSTTFPAERDALLAKVGELRCKLGPAVFDVRITDAPPYVRLGSTDDMRDFLRDVRAAADEAERAREEYLKHMQDMVTNIVSPYVWVRVGTDLADDGSVTFVNNTFTGQ